MQKPAWELCFEYAPVLVPCTWSSLVAPGQGCSPIAALDASAGKVQLDVLGAEEGQMPWQSCPVWKYSRCAVRGSVSNMILNVPVALIWLQTHTKQGCEGLQCWAAACWMLTLWGLLSLPQKQNHPEESKVTFISSSKKMIEFDKLSPFMDRQMSSMCPAGDVWKSVAMKCSGSWASHSCWGVHIAPCAPWRCVQHRAAVGHCPGESLGELCCPEVQEGGFHPGTAPVPVVPGVKGLEVTTGGWCCPGEGQRARQECEHRGGAHPSGLCSAAFKV